MATFASLGIRPAYIRSLAELQITTPTKIQQESIPLLLQGKTDFIGLAQTGTGKTAAYGLPLLHKIDPAQPVIQALVLSPTRELVQQIKKQLFKFTKYAPQRIFTEAVFGGEKIEKQLKALQRPTHVIIATPGRLIDLIERGRIDLSQLQTLVLDEADEMLSMGFKQELDQILKYSNKKRNTWLFSATMPDEIQQLVKKYMAPKTPRIEVLKNTLVNEHISHHYVALSVKEKFDYLCQLLKEKKQQRGIIFCRTKAAAQDLTQKLTGAGFSVAALEGNMGQRDRDKVMRMFKSKRLQFLVSTDVSARGIDVANLSFVIHYQLPEQTAYYTHRSGRTARAGKTGISIALITPGELPKLKALEDELNIQFSELTL